jgi:hypothetical protein
LEDCPVKFLIGLVGIGLWAQSLPVGSIPISSVSTGLSFIAAVQNSSSCSGNSIASPSLNVLAGDTLIIAVGIGSGGAYITAPTTNDSETAAIIGSSMQQAYGFAYRMAAYTVANATADSAKVVTENLSSGVNCGIVVLQFRGSSSYVIDISNAVNAGSFNAASGICVPSTSSTPTTCSSSFTPSVAGEAAVLFGTLFTGGGDSIAAGTICGNTAAIPTNGQTSDSFQRVTGEYLLNIGTSPCTATFNYSPTGYQGMGMVVTLKP